MPQRELRLGDTVDDYCPRERRITDHAVVAMIEDRVRQTRCTTCEAEHVYKAAQVPAARMKKAQLKPPQDASPPDTPSRVEDARATAGAVPASAPIPETGDVEAEGTDPTPGSRPDAAATGEEGAQVPNGLAGVDNGPVRRSLIRATLPRQHTQPPMRPAQALTVRTTGGRPNGFRDGESRGNQHANRHRGNSGERPARTGGARHPDARPTWHGREMNGRPVLLSHHSQRRSPNGSQSRARQADSAQAARHGKKRSR